MHKDTQLGQVPTSYLEWCIRDNAGAYIPNFISDIRKELDRRREAEEHFMNQTGNTSNGETTYRNSQGQKKTNPPRPGTYGMDCGTTKRNPEVEFENMRRRWTEGTWNSTDDMADAFKYGAQTEAPPKPEGDTFIRAQYEQLKAEVARLKTQSRNDSATISQLRGKISQLTSECQMLRNQGSGGMPKLPSCGTRVEAQELIKIGMRTLAHKWHPDVNKSADAHKKTIAINGVYAWLEKCVEKLPNG
jgi:hypothetical protein